MKTTLAVWTFSLLFSVHLSAGELIKPESILGKQELCLSDGSSVYYFMPDKTFRLEPIGISGRTIEGTWALDSNGIHISGQWSWINGLSALDDFREMDIHIGYLQNETRDHTSSLQGTKHKIHNCYFLIERVEKVKDKQASGGNS
ncbi:MAG: hypothetical protein KDA78_09365 [Planctomycetaceae bacterium]|nr:hypothetical protein [Planctomycetaceae bacterium]